MRRILPLMLTLCLLGCGARISTNPLPQDKIDIIWNKVIEVTGTSPKTEMPKIAFLEENFYQQLLEKNCAIQKKEKKKKCKKELEEIGKRVKRALGKSYKKIYGEYLDQEWKLRNEDCSQYKDEKKEKCEEDKKTISTKQTSTLGLAFLGDNRIEIFPKVINKISLWGNHFSYKQRKAYFLGTVAHEMLHFALYKKGLSANKHHLLMKDKHYMEQLMDFISDQLGAPKDGFHKNYHIKSLDAGIELDKRIQERMKK